MNDAVFRDFWTLAEKAIGEPPMHNIIISGSPPSLLTAADFRLGSSDFDS